MPHRGRTRAQRQPDAHLVHPFVDELRHHPIQADPGEQQREPGERGKERGAEAPLR